MASVTLKNVVKKYNEETVVKNLDLHIHDGEFVVVVGPSGCGKSTTLRIIAGLESISQGEVFIGNNAVTHLPPRQRNVSMVFQNYALYPHMSVRENLGFSLKIVKKPQTYITNAVNEAAAILGLSALLDRKPFELSGGQKQRVAMGRAIVRHPEVFLFDEPLSNLDAKLRNQMRIEIKKLHQKIGSTIVYVTHDQVEAMTLADRIIVMKDGIIVQQGTPEHLFSMPVNTFVATFIGSPPMNLIPAKITEKKEIALQDGHILPLPEHANAKVEIHQEIVLGFRADNLNPIGHGVADAKNVFDVELPIVLTEPLGAETLLYTNFGGVEVQAKMLNPLPVNIDEKQMFQLGIDHCHIFDTKRDVALRN